MLYFKVVLECICKIIRLIICKIFCGVLNIGWKLQNFLLVFTNFGLMSILGNHKGIALFFIIFFHQKTANQKARISLTSNCILLKFCSKLITGVFISSHTQGENCYYKHSIYTHLHLPISNHFSNSVKKIPILRWFLKKMQSDVVSISLYNY